MAENTKDLCARCGHERNAHAGFNDMCIAVVRAVFCGCGKFKEEEEKMRTINVAAACIKRLFEEPASEVGVDITLVVRFLLCRRPISEHELSGAWEIPGGKANSGEKLTDVLRRELGEEINCRFFPGNPVKVHAVCVDVAGERFEVHVFEIIDKDREVVPEMKEHIGLMWVTLGEAITMRHQLTPATKSFVMSMMAAKAL